MDDESGKNCCNSLSRIGEIEILRKKFVDLCKYIEKEMDTEHDNIRDDITGPILDAIHKRAGIINKKLSNGLEIYFIYTSKIARDFIMSSPEAPNHVWEPQTTKLLLYLASQLKAKNVVIGGAYFGDQALLISNEIKKYGGICHAFEPNKGLNKILTLNKDKNRMINLIPNLIALWDEDNAILRFSGEDAYASTVLASEMRDEETITTITIETYLKDKGIKNVELIMLDIEGGELNALKGAKKYLEKPWQESPTVVFEIHRNFSDWSNGLDRCEIIKYLRSLGYFVYSIRDYHSNVDMHGQPIELIETKNTYLEGPPHGFNMLAIKDSRLIDNSLFSICKEKVSPKLLKHKDPHIHHPLH